ncbi:MAG TPA: pyruvate kinase [Rhizobiales bacterium]|nr:pyruvate kinase [bacterium BMS3Bbin10]HDO52575.1 pyruvate kinase [Hyphomicrobiales bacterium]
MRRNRRVKIVATLGPSSSDPDTIRCLFEAGADVFRINMSHASAEGLTELHRVIRKIEADAGRPIGILVDLQGPKLRVGEFADGAAELVEGEIFRFDRNEELGTAQRVHLPHPEIFRAVEPGHKLILDDGKLHLVVRETSPDSISAQVVTGGALASRKGISLPDTVLPFGAMTDKDRKDLEQAVNLGADWIGLSFVQRSDDVAEARKLTRGRVAIMTKIEKPSAIDHLDSILELSDGLMVARGDLGVEMPLEQVPGLQKRITLAARRTGKPVVIATQMLESMITAPVPTRAEVSDVATAVFDGADAIMLSAESAAGQFPVEAVVTMDKIAIEVERDAGYERLIHAQEIEPEATAADAISAAARTVSETLNLAAIVCYTGSGSTGLRAARERPRQPVIALTPIAATARRLAMVWGLHCVLTSDAEDLDEMVEKACRIAFREGFARPGQRVIVSAGVPLGTPGATNLLRVAFVGENEAGSI